MYSLYIRGWLINALSHYQSWYLAKNVPQIFLYQIKVVEGKVHFVQNVVEV